MFARYVFCLLALLLFAGVGHSEESTRQTLRWMGHWKDRGLREQLVLEVRDEFQFLHQDTDIQLTFPADLLPQNNKEQVAKLIAEMIRAGRVDWDVIYLDPTIYYYVAEALEDPDWGRKHLVDFSAFPDVKAAHRPFLIEGPDAHKGTGGVFVGPYIEGFYTCLWYNTAVAEKVGLDIRDEEMSAHDLLSYLSRVKEYNRTAEVPVSGFVDFQRSEPFHRLAYNLYLSEHLAHPETPTEKILTRILRFFDEMQAYDTLIYDNPSYTWQDAAQLLMDDKALFLIEPTWRYSSLQSYVPEVLEKLRPAQLPGFEKQSFYTGGYISTWAVMKHSPMRDLGIELLRFWCTPSIAQKWVRYTKSPTGLSGSFYDSEYGIDAMANFQNRLISGRTLQRDILFANFGESPVSPILDYIYPVILGEMTADEVLQKIGFGE